MSTDGAAGAGLAHCQSRRPPRRATGAGLSAAVPRLECAVAMGGVAISAGGGGTCGPWRWAGLQRCSKEQACNGVWIARPALPPASIVDMGEEA